MAVQISDIRSLLIQSFKEPRAAARRVIDLHASSTAAWQMLLLVVIVTVLIGQAIGYLAAAGRTDGSSTAPVEPLPADLQAIDAIIGSLFSSPFTIGFFFGCFLVVLVFCVHWIGRVFGGKGEFEDALSLVAWHQFVMLCLQLAGFVVVMIVPSAVGLYMTLVFGANLWLLTMFVSELHGFRSPVLVLLMIIISFFAVIVGLSIILSIILVLAGVEVPNA